MDLIILLVLQFALVCVIVNANVKTARHGRVAVLRVESLQKRRGGRWVYCPFSNHCGQV